MRHPLSASLFQMPHATSVPRASMCFFQWSSTWNRRRSSMGLVTKSFMPTAKISSWVSLNTSAVRHTMGRLGSTP